MCGSKICYLIGNSRLIFWEIRTEVYLFLVSVRCCVCANRGGRSSFKYGLFVSIIYKIFDYCII